MTTLIAVAFAFIGLTSLFLESRRDDRFIAFIDLLFLLGVSGVLLTTMEGESKGSVLILMGIAALNFVISQVKLLRKKGIRVLVPLVSVVVYIYLLNGTSVSFFGDAYPLINKFLIVAAIISVIGYEIGAFKLYVINKWIGEASEKDTMRSLLLFMVGVAIFLGTFQSGLLGLLVVATSFLSASFYRDERNSVASSLIALAFIPYLLSLSDYTTINLLGNDVLAGIFLGAFAALFIQKMWDAQKRSVLLIGVGYFISLAAALGLLYNHMMYASMGGMDTFVAFIVGAAIVLGVTGKGYVSSGLFALLFVGGTLVPLVMVNPEQDEFEMDTIVTNSDENGEQEVQLETVQLADIVGDYELAEGSKVSFVLGENDATKGAFKQIEGAISIKEEVWESTFDIDLDMEHFTTFNKYRDESLFSEEYFSVDKYPTMKYVGSDLKAMEDGYDIIGKFTMLDATKDLNVSVKCVKVDGENVLMGTGKIDRTLFGMTPSPQEGNIVTFNYEARLKEK